MSVDVDVCCAAVKNIGEFSVFKDKKGRCIRCWKVTEERIIEL